MRRAVPRAVICLLACLILLPASAQAASPEELMATELNQTRAAFGRPELSVSQALTGSAEDYAAALGRHGSFAHGSPIAVAGDFRQKAEILALRGGDRPSVAPTVRAWLASPGHRTILLDPDYDWVGVGRAQGRFGGRWATVWVVHFGRR